MWEKKENIVNIEIKRLFPHPDNPRKDIGDVTELAESIKKNGIMQNLTVIPGHRMTELEWLELERKYKENPNEELRHAMNSGYVDSDYTLIIGHRRHAAAVRAGLTELPCRVVENLSHREQVSIMLEENMQRNDLTIYEQAQGFQMMLDLGETVETIAEKTGFSKTTVNRRLNIAKLDQELIQKKTKDESFQLSLSDLYALEQIEDIKTRNKVLREASNHDQVIWKAKNAAAEEKRLKKMKVIIEKLEVIGVKKATKKAESEQYGGKWETVKEISLDKDIPEKVTLKGKELYYLRWCNCIRVIRKKTQKKVKTKGEIEREQIDKNKKLINTKVKQMEKSMEEFVREIAIGTIRIPKETQTYIDYVWKLLMDTGVCVNKNRIIEVLLDLKTYWDATEEDKKKTAEQIEKMSTYKQMLCVIISGNRQLEMADYNGYYMPDKAKRLTEIYNLLEQYGFIFETEEELQILDGSHGAYRKKEEVLQ